MLLVRAEVMRDLVAHGDRHLAAQLIAVAAEGADERVAEDVDGVVVRVVRPSPRRTGRRRRRARPRSEITIATLRSSTRARTRGGRRSHRARGTRTPASLGSVAELGRRLGPAAASRSTASSRPSNSSSDIRAISPLPGAVRNDPQRSTSCVAASPPTGSSRTGGLRSVAIHPMANTMTATNARSGRPCCTETRPSAQARPTHVVASEHGVLPDRVADKRAHRVRVAVRVVGMRGHGGSGVKEPAARDVAAARRGLSPRRAPGTRAPGVARHTWCGGWIHLMAHGGIRWIHPYVTSSCGVIVTLPVVAAAHDEQRDRRGRSSPRSSAAGGPRPSAARRRPPRRGGPRAAGRPAPRASPRRPRRPRSRGRGPGARRRAAAAGAARRRRRGRRAARGRSR